jgi:hypothetical protein
MYQTHFMRINPYIRLFFLILIGMNIFTIIITNTNNFFSQNSTKNSIKEEISQLTLEKNDNFDDIKRGLKEEFTKDSKNEVLFKVKNDELTKLKTAQQQLEDKIEAEEKNNNNTMLIAR